MTEQEHSRQELTGRYIYAVTRRLPKKQRGDVAKELESIISDMLEERCGPITPTEHDLRVVLTELGTPSELARKYGPHGERYLIGPDYFDTYWFTLKIVLAANVFGMVLAGVLGTVVKGGNRLTALWETIGNNVSGLFFAFGVITALFAFFSWRGIRVRVGSDSLDDLPPVPKASAEIKRSECVVGIVISAILTVLFLTMPEYFGLPVSTTGQIIPLFAPDVVREMWLVILAMAVLGIGSECVKLLEGRYTWRVFASCAAANVLSGVLASVWLTDANVLNPDFTQRAVDLLGEEGAVVALELSRSPLYLLGILILALTLETVAMLVKTLRAERACRG